METRFTVSAAPSLCLGLSLLVCKLGPVRLSNPRRILVLRGCPWKTGSGLGASWEEAGQTGRRPSWQVLLLSALLRGAWASSRLGVGTHLGVSVRRGLSAGAGVGVSGQASWC